MNKLFLVFLFSQFSFSQSPTTFEDKIYTAVDLLSANPNAQNLKNLEALGKSFLPKSNAELAAFVHLKCNEGYYQKQFGFLDKAIKSYELAWQSFQKSNKIDYDIIEYCLKPLGNLYTTIGDYDNAENIIKQYFYSANIHNNSELKYAAILNLSTVYQNTGRIDQAIDLIEKTLKIEKLSSSQKGTLLGSLAANYMLISKIEKARKALETSINLLKLDTSQSEKLSNGYRNLSKIYSQENNFEKANEYLEKSRIELVKNPNAEPRKIAKLFYDKALLLFQQQNYSLSAVFISDIFTTLIPNYSKSKKELPDKNSLYAETTLLEALDLQAEIYLAQKQSKKALESYQLSFYIEAVFQSLLVYENSKIINQIRNRNRTEKCVEIYYSLFQKENKVSYIESAFLLQEKTKSAVLKQAVFNNKNISKEEKQVQQELQDCNNSILKEQQKGDFADIAKINDAIKKQNELMLLLKTKKDKNNNAEKALDIDNLFSKLEDDQAVMVEYFYGVNKIYVFTLQHNAIQLECIDNISKQIIQFIDFFTDAEKITNNVINYNYTAFSVYKNLKLPKKSTLKNLIVIPDGILTFLPFDCLITKKSSTNNFARMNYLIKDFIIGYSNSADFYLNAIPVQHSKESVLGVFPVFENSALELAFSKKELVAIKKNFEGKYYQNKEATFTNFKKEAINYSILHLSTHASSGDIYEPSTIMFYDRKVLYSELYNLNINPNLVVLSACETGLGKLYKSEGAMSVARGFQFAGAQNLLFSLWKVNDYTTSVLMKKFYSNVKNGNTYFKSCHQAKLSFLNDLRISNAKKSPYYWSAFVYYGAIENNTSTNYLVWVIGIVSLIGLFLIFKFISQRYTKKHRVS